jgi:hypothetical protein
MDSESTIAGGVPGRAYTPSLLLPGPGTSDPRGSGERSALLDAVGVSVPRTPSTARSITLTDRPHSSSAWNRRAGSSSVASTPAESTRQSIPRPASSSSVSRVARAAPLEPIEPPLAAPSRPVNWRWQAEVY